MTTIYPLKPKAPPKTTLKKIFSVLVVVVLFVLLVTLLQSNPVLTVLGPVGTPIWKTKQALLSWTFGFSSGFKDKQNLAEENRRLKEELFGLNAVVLERDVLLEQNNALKKIQSGDTSEEIARVLTSPTQSLYDVVILELMPNSEVKVGDKVLASGNVVLGEITERSGKIAKMRFFSSPGNKTATRLLPSGAELLLEGQGGGNFVVTVPRSFDVSIGQIVSLPTFGHFTIGRVGAIEDARADSFKNVFVSYPVNIFSLMWVRVISSYNAAESTI